jgi:signal transduction histidine kinase
VTAAEGAAPAVPPGAPKDVERRAGRKSASHVPLVSGLSLAVLGIVLATASLAPRRPYSGLVWIEGTGLVIGIDAGSPAAAAGLRVDDVVLEVNGQPTTSVRRSSAAWGAGVAETVPITFRRDGDVRSTIIRTAAPSLEEQLDRLEAPLIALCFALLGFGVWAHKPYDRTVVAFLLFTYSIALVLAVGWLSRLGLPLMFLGYIALLSLTAASSVHFHLLFPRARAVPRRLSGVLLALALAVPALYLPGLVQDRDVLWYTLASNAAVVYLVSGVLACAALLADAYRKAASEEERRRVRLVVLGTLLGAAPGVCLSLLPETLGPARRFFVPWELTLPFLLLIPIAYVLAILRHDLLRVERLANRGVVHLVVFGLVVGLYVAMALGMPLLAPWADGPVLRAVIVLLVALLFGPMRRRLQKAADRFFYGGWYDYRSVLGEMTRGLAAIVDADTLADLLGRRLPQIIRVQGASLLLPGGELGLEEASGTGWPGEAFPRTLDRSGPLGLALVRASRPLTSTELAASAEGPAEDDQAWLRHAEIELWVPLVLRDTLQGILLLGAKPAGEAFDAEDRRLLATLAWSAAVAVENVRLFSALRRRADEVNQLYSQLVQSREEERKRLARELHDRVIQDLVNLNYFLEPGPAGAASKATVEAARERLRGVVDSLRQVSTELRPSALDDLSLGLAVQGYLEEARGKYGLKIVLRLPAGSAAWLEALPEPVRVTLFRVLQEAIQNVHRHARANRVDVDLALDGDAVTLEVRDDGRGFRCPPELGGLVRQRHFGLAGAQERMALVGGRLELVSGVGRGTTLRATAPLAP